MTSKIKLNNELEKIFYILLLYAFDFVILANITLGAFIIGLILKLFIKGGK